MELSKLQDRICAGFRGEPSELESILEIIKDDDSIFPFNEYEYLICHLIETKGLTFENYLEIRSEYMSENPNLWIFEISAPRNFGEGFAQTHIQGKCAALKQASRKLDAQFSGQYDLWLNGIRIEVKASRAVDSSSDEPLYMRALSRITDKPFLMNFQQLKPQCCDVFVWVAVFRDEIVIWVMSAGEVERHPLYSQGQHRGNIGNEGQLHIRHDNIHTLDPFELGENNLGDAIKNAAQRGT